MRVGGRGGGGCGRKELEKRRVGGSRKKVLSRVHPMGVGWTSSKRFTSGPREKERKIREKTPGKPPAEDGSTDSMCHNKNKVQGRKDPEGGSKSIKHVQTWSAGRASWEKDAGDEGGTYGGLWEREVKVLKPGREPHRKGELVGGRIPPNLRGGSLTENTGGRKCTWVWGEVVFSERGRASEARSL